ncbi:hypothetical protein AA313_de0207016 [Arthrobotrys entomopaga]|nr:hypothetical protein AA313_de0207016 [Arthrobotrys entomopaga]
MPRTKHQHTRKRQRSQREVVRESSEEQEEEEEEEGEEEGEEEQPQRRRRRIHEPPTRHHRRSTVANDEEDEEEEEEEERPTHPATSSLQARKAAAKRKAPRRRRRDSDEDSEEDGEEEGEGDGEQEEEEEERGGKGVSPVSKLVRLALAMEYQKKPIRRQDITEKVLGPSFKSDFKGIFDEAQTALRLVFGFQMVELPAVTEKISLAQQRRAAAAEAQRGNAATAATATQQDPSSTQAKKKKETTAVSSSKSWQLVSTLPDKYRIPLLHAPPLPDDQTVLGLTTTVLSMIYLSNRAISENLLLRHLRKFDITDRIPVEGNRENGKVENILGKMVREGYIVKLKDEVVAGQEQTFTYVIGPRGKLEMGRTGVTDFVRRVYEGVDGGVDDGFVRRVNRALGKETEEDVAMENGGGSTNENHSNNNGGGEGGVRRRNRRRRDDDDEDEEDSD